MFSVELEFTLPELEGPFGGLVASFVGNSASFDGLIAPSSMRSDPSREMASWSVTQSGSRAGVQNGTQKGPDGYYNW